MTIQEHWNNYKTGCYRQSMTPEQERQVYGAFLAGATVAVGEAVSLSRLPEQEGVDRFDRLYREVVQLCEQHIATWQAEVSGEQERSE